jgi:hypothetical protein
MDFQAFDQVQNYFTGPGFYTGKQEFKQSLLDAMKAFLSTPKHIGYYQAYIRAHTGAAIQAVHTNLVNQTHANLANETDVQRRTRIYADVENLWTNTVKNQAIPALANEALIRMAYYTTGLGVGTFPTLDDFFHRAFTPNHPTHKCTPRICTEYMQLLTATIAPFRVETPLNKYNQTHKQAVKAIDPLDALAQVQNFDELKAPDGGVNEAQKHWKTLLECTNFWETELPRLQARNAIRLQMANAVAPGNKLILYRLVSSGEKDFVLPRKAFAQGPTSFERHKWFFGSGGAPGVGHAVKLKITMARGTWALFHDTLAVEVNDESKSTSGFGVIKKQNEHICIGIHEELLDAFSAMVEKVEVVT